MGRQPQLALCHNFRREVEALLAERPELDGLVTFAAACLQPTLDWQRVARLQGAEPTRALEVIGAGCLQALGTPPNPAWRAHRVTHCQALVAGSTLVEAALREGAYTLTPGWLERWPAQLHAWGFDAAGARAFFAETTTKLVLFDTGVLPDAERLLRDLAAHVALPFERVEVGLDHLRLFLLHEASRRAAESARHHETAQLARAHRQAADLLMIFDVVSTLTGLSDERAAIDRLLALLEQLCSPRRVAFLPVTGGAPGALRPDGSSDALRWLQSFTASTDETRRLGEDGFLLRLSHQGETLGALLVEGVRFPAHRDHYLTVALPVARVGAMALANARGYEAQQRTIAELHAAHEAVARLEGLIPICSYCKKIRDDQGYWQAVERYVPRAPGADFTHGICTSCMERHFPEELGAERGEG